MTGAVGNLVIAFKSSNNYDSRPKKKIDSNKKCFNCHRLEHYAQDCTISNKCQINKNNQGQSSNRRG